MKYEFYDRDEASGTIFLRFRNQEIQYKQLMEIEFNSDRKRHTVFIEDENKNVIIYMKGADNIIIDRLSQQEDYNIIQNYKEILEKWSNLGLRTLV